MPENPAYLRIVAELRDQIRAGDLAPGDKLPTEAQLRQRYGVSTTVVKWALSILKGEGLVEGRRGSGNYVRQSRRITRNATGRALRSDARTTSPFARDASVAGQQPTWEHDSRHDTADERIAARLEIEPGSAVMRTDYRYLADDLPVQLATSWEPSSLTSGTPVEWPEDAAAVGVVARFDAIGIRIDEFAERVSARAADTQEIERLELPSRGSYVLVVERTYYAAGQPVETADIVFPGDRYELLYRIPID
ncbi:GntR family transcriptional regulator [Micromonosporaceae bacterium B7E4]